MTTKLRSWWQKIKQRRVTIIVTIAIVVVAVALIIVGYRFDWAGFNGYTQVSTIHTISGPTAGTVTRTEAFQPEKTLWDWMQLLIIPLVLAVAALLFQLANSRTERQIAKQRYEQDLQIAKQRYEQDQQIALDKQHEDLLQAYIDKISELLLKEHLGELTADGKLNPEFDQVRNVARVRTITVLTQLNARRISYVFAFLREAGLMSKTSDSSVVSLKDADLRAVKWSQADLSEADLSEAKLSEAVLNEAKLSKANLSGADLGEAKLGRADLSEAKLSKAILIKAYLSKAILRDADLSEAKLWGAHLSGAHLRGARLSKANLSRANLSRADLRDADLSGADLSGADLSGAKVTEEQLKKANSLKEATMSNGSKHP